VFSEAAQFGFGESVKWNIRRVIGVQDERNGTVEAAHGRCRI
jgi:hypothetical protein